MESFKTPKPLELQGNLSENWNKFYQSFEIYMAATTFNIAADARKIAILLNTIGEDALEIYNNFKLTEEQLKKYSVVVDVFKNYCNPKKNLRYNRFIFYKRKKITNILIIISQNYKSSLKTVSSKPIHQMIC